MTADALNRVLLVGFMGSGKTSVGRCLADRLGWRFIDFDEAIVRESGTSIPDLFEQQGEPRFRALEARVAEGLLEERAVVLGSGGGWGAVPGRLETLPPGTESFWLQVSAQTAFRRTSAEAGTRPLLDRADALREASQLLAMRDPIYGQARWAVDTEHSSVEDVTALILDILLREHPEILTS